MTTLDHRVLPYPYRACIASSAEALGTVTLVAALRARHSAIKIWQKMQIGLRLLLCNRIARISSLSRIIARTRMQWHLHRTHPRKIWCMPTTARVYPRQDLREISLAHTINLLLPVAHLPLHLAQGILLYFRAIRQSRSLRSPQAIYERKARKLQVSGAGRHLPHPELETEIPKLVILVSMT